MADSPNRPDGYQADRDAARARLAKRQARRGGTPDLRYSQSDYHGGDGARQSADAGRPQIKVVGGRDVKPRDSRTGASRSQDSRRGTTGNSGFESHSAPTAREGARNALGAAGRTVGSAASKGFRWAASHTRIVVILVVVILLAICVGTMGRACSARQNEKNMESQRASYEQQSQLIEGEINLPASLDPQIESTLKEKALSNGDIDWIIRHTSALSMDGDKVLKKLLKLTAKEDTAVSFVRNFPDKYPQEEGEPYNEKVTAGAVPTLYQWDERWGYTVYSSTAFALTGCCPTCMSMVYMGLTGNNDKTPYDMGVLADEMGYMDTFNGTADTFLTEAAPKLGLSAQKITVSSSALEGALSQGKVVICNVSEGDFTDGGHYLVIAACDKKGMLTINDPFSAVNSAQKWDINTVISQTKGLWTYSLA